MSLLNIVINFNLYIQYLLPGRVFHITDKKKDMKY